MEEGGAVRRVLVLGVGNILLKDEGVGVRVIEAMRREYAFPEGVVLYDGATAGLDLMPVIEGFGHVVIVDTVRAGGEPGSLYRFTLDDIALKVPYKTSLHQIGIIEMFAIYEALDKARPEVVIIGVEPKDMSSWGLELTETIQAKLPEVVGLVLGELEALGVRGAPGQGRP